MLTSTVVDADIVDNFSEVVQNGTDGTVRHEICIYFQQGRTISTYSDNNQSIRNPSITLMSDNRLSYHRRKFEDEILVTKQEPKCRIWDQEEIDHIIEQS